MYQLGLFGNVESGKSVSSAAASRARTSQRPAEARALRAAARVYGERCLGLSARSDPLGSSLRTFLCSACEALTGLSLRWKKSATPAGHWWLVLGRSGRRTKGTGCGSSENWLTITVKDSEKPAGDGDATIAKERSATSSQRLRNQIHWPTVHGNAVGKNWQSPKCADAKDVPYQYDQGDHDKPRATLYWQATNWPTATAANVRSPKASEATLARNSRPLQEVVGQHAQDSPSTPGKPRGSLNSAWVMQLMGFPTKYADELIRLSLEFAATPGATRTQG